MIESVRAMIELILSLEGFEVDTAEDGLAAIALARATRPDVVVLDVMMPNVDGFEAAEVFRRRPGLHDIPIVFCTAMGTSTRTGVAGSSAPPPTCRSRSTTSDLVAEVMSAANAGSRV